eukprot:6036988-Amphidinium_carterae.1
MHCRRHGLGINCSLDEGAHDLNTYPQGNLPQQLCAIHHKKEEWWALLRLDAQAFPHIQPVQGFKAHGFCLTEVAGPMIGNEVPRQFLAIEVLKEVEWVMTLSN